MTAHAEIAREGVDTDGAPGRIRAHLREIRALADAQHGVVARRQLRAAGVSVALIDHWLRAGRLRPLHRGVYALGHDALVSDGRCLAAVLACGDGAALSFVDAGAFRGLCATFGTRFHVTVPRGRGRSGRGRPGIHVHVCDLAPYEVEVVRGVPVTTVARTLLDLATMLGEERLGEAVDRAIELGLYDQDDIDRVCGQGRPGSAALRRVIARRHPDSHLARSRMERKMLRLVDEFGLPRPQVNQALPELGVIPDLLWPEAKVAVELDSWTHHRTREAFEKDRRKTLVLQRAGYTVLRFTWRQVTRERSDTARHVRDAIARSCRR